MFSKLNLKQKVLGALLLVGIIPFSYIAIKATQTSQTSSEKQAFAQLEAVRNIKKSAIERYYSTIENQLITTANNPTVVSATTELNNAFQRFPEEAGINSSDLNKQTEQVKKYWQNEFGKEFQKQNNTEFSFEAFNTLSEDAIHLQYAFIANNSHPLGSKNKLNKSKDTSSYSQIHNLYHPWFNQFLDKFGYYDIFLVNTSGQVVYSVFK